MCSSDLAADLAVRQSNQVSILSGKTLQVIGKVTAPTSSKTFGSSLSVVPDLNEDGGADLLIADLSRKTVYAYSIDMGGLSVSHGSVSVSLGGKQDLFVRAGSTHAKKLYLILGSMTGTSPGIAFGKVNLPLVSDAYFGLTASAPNTWIANSLGILDGEGRATGSITLAPKQHTAFQGRTLYHAVLAIDLFPFSIDWASNSAALKLNP